MFPCAVTFTNATLVQDVLIVSLPGGSTALVTVQGMTANEGWTMITRSIATIDFITALAACQEETLLLLKKYGPDQVNRKKQSISTDIDTLHLLIDQRKL